MTTLQESIVLKKEDHEILLSYLRGQFGKTLFDQQNAEAMQAELLKARIVSREEFPGDAVALNSMVKIKDDLRGRVMDLVLVTPDKADISKNHISVLAPIGIALIGYRKGDKINWKMPSGNRSFTIMEVKNPD